MIFLFLSIVLNLILLYLIWVSYNKQIVLQTVLIRVMNTVDNVYVALKEVDLRGAFEAEDEVGFVFQDILSIVAILHELIIEDEENKGEDLNDGADENEEET